MIYIGNESVRRRIAARLSYSSGNPHSVRSPVISTTSGRGLKFATTRHARSVSILVSDTRLQATPRGRTCRSVSWQISITSLRYSGSPPPAVRCKSCPLLLQPIHNSLAYDPLGRDPLARDFSRALALQPWQRLGEHRDAL